MAEKRIVILDDFYPNPLSAFRLQEFNYYLANFSGVEVYSSGQSFGAVNETRTVSQVVEAHIAANPAAAGRVYALLTDDIPDADAYYAIFLNNIYQFIDPIEERRRPFAFTLYPGGGIQLNDHVSDEKLTRAVGSQYCKKVIVTQRVVADYLIDRRFCTAGKIEFVYGGVVPPVSERYPRQRYGFEKLHLDLAFVANKYTPIGADKGYDLFVAAAIELSRRHANISFHVVGGFDHDVIDVSELGNRIKFYGFREIPFFDEFYRTIDIFVSPNRASVLSPGGFDGFPTGAAVDAVLRGTALICSDPLGLNVAFSPGNDFVLVETAQEPVVLAIENLMADPAGLDAVARRGRARFGEVFGQEAQFRPRLAVLNSLINST